MNGKRDISLKSVSNKLTDSQITKKLRSTASMPRLRPSGRRLGATSKKNTKNTSKHVNVPKNTTKRLQSDKNSSRSILETPKRSPRASQRPPEAAQELPRDPQRQLTSSPGTLKSLPKTPSGSPNSLPKTPHDTNFFPKSLFSSRSAGTSHFTTSQRFPINLS